MATKNAVPTTFIGRMFAAFVEVATTKNDEDKSVVRRKISESDTWGNKSEFLTALGIPLPLKSGRFNTAEDKATNKTAQRSLKQITAHWKEMYGESAILNWRRGKPAGSRAANLLDIPEVAAEIDSILANVVD